MTPVPRTRTVAYLRVSTDKQAEDGVSLAAQREKVIAYAALYDLELVDIIEDAGESAGSLDRPGLQRALGMLKSGQASALLVVKLDRLTRSVRDLCDLVERWFSRKYGLLCVTEQVDTRSANGRMFLNLLTTIGQWEREQCGERTKVAMTHKRSRSEYLGGKPPYGYRLAQDGAHLEVVPGELAVISRARELRATGLSLAGIAERLAADGHVNSKGNPFAPNQVRRFISTGPEQPT